MLWQQRKLSFGALRARSQMRFVASEEMYDSHTQIRGVPVVFAQKGRQDRQKAQPWNVFNDGEGETARARGSVLQEALKGQRS
jgi:hypothetical protein